MTKRHDLAAIVNQISEDDLAALAPDDVLILLEGLLRHAPDPAVAAARRKLATAILRNATRTADIASRSRYLH
jgi:hypothetical protein